MSITKEPCSSCKTGSDVRGIATEGVEGQHVNLTGEAVNLSRRRSPCGSRRRKTPRPPPSKSAWGTTRAVSAPALKAQVLRGTRRAGRRRLRLRARVHPVDVHVDRLPRDAVRRRRHDHREPPALQPQRAQVFRRGRRPGEPRHHRPAAHRRLPHARPGGPLQGAADPAALPLREQPAGKNPPGRRRGGL